LKKKEIKSNIIEYNGGLTCGETSPREARTWI